MTLPGSNYHETRVTCFLVIFQTATIHLRLVNRGDHRPILPSIRGLFSDELGKSNDTQHDASRMDNTVLEGTSSRPARWPSRGVQPLSGPGMRPKLLPSLSSGSLTPMLPRMKIHPPESQWEGITFPPLRPLPSIAAHPPPLTLPPLKQRPLDPDARFQQSSITNAYSLDRGRYMRNNAGPHDGRIPDPYDHVLDYVDPSPGASRHSETISRETFYQPGRSGRSNSDRPPRPQAERTLGADDDAIYYRLRLNTDAHFVGNGLNGRADLEFT